jgi:hypothetical protein
MEYGFLFSSQYIFYLVPLLLDCLANIKIPKQSTNESSDTATTNDTHVQCTVKSWF